MPSSSSPPLRDRLFVTTTRASAIGTGSLVLFILAFVALEAMPALSEIGPIRFLADGDWRPSDGEYGLAPMIAGTLATAIGATAIAAPIGIGTAVFAHSQARPAVRNAIRHVLELLAGIPSVVFGLWGLVVLVPRIAAWSQPGTSLLAASIVLAIMILPTIAITAESAFRSVPKSLRIGAAALGLSREATTWRVVVPAARSGIEAGVVLALARAIGETMAVLMVAGNVVQWPTSPFSPVRTVTTNIALEMSYATSSHRSALFVSGLTLMVLIGTLTLATALRARGLRSRHD